VLAKRAIATAFTKKDTEVLKQLNDVAFSGASSLRCPGTGHKVAAPGLLGRDWGPCAPPGPRQWDIHKLASAQMGETTRCGLRRVSAMGTPLVQSSHPALLRGAESGIGS
jgi:hypothetical protein